MYYISYGCSFLDGEKAFRVPWGLQMIPAVILAIGLVFLPESPRWLVLKGRDDEAWEVLAALSDLPKEDKKIVTELQAVKDVVFEMSRGGFRECFKTNRNRNFHRTVLAYVNQMFQQVRSQPCT